MNSLFRLAALCLVPCFGVSTSVLAADVDQRLQRIERTLQNQNLPDLTLQLQQLQREVQQLRGELELQKHTMDAMSRRQRDLYLDIDQRLSRIQPGTDMLAPPVSGYQPMAADQMTPPPPVNSAEPSVSVPAAVAVTPPDPKKEEMAYQEAFNLLKQGRYSESIKAFNAFLRDYSGGNYEDNAQYWLAEASYVNRDYDTALTAFSKVPKKYPKSSKVPGAMLKMGYIYYEKQNWEVAKRILGEIQSNFPETTEARLAEKRLQRLSKEGR
jgi:tol-pal system protein YbgF